MLTKVCLLEWFGRCMVYDNIIHNMKKYDSNDLEVAFAIGFLIGIGVMFINIFF